MKDRLLTVLISCLTTYGLVGFTEREPPVRELEVDRLIVRRELIVSDSGKPWEEGYEQQQIPRGIYARSAEKGPGGAAAGGLWVRSRLIKGELDDPCDDRFHALETDGSLRRSPGHISWNMWLDGAWRQVAIVQGEALDAHEVAKDAWSGSNHPGRLRLQSFRPHHSEPLTDALIGQGGMSLGGGGYGGGGLPYAKKTLEIWGGALEQHGLTTPHPPRILKTNGDKPHRYSLIALGAFGEQTAPSLEIEAPGLATLEWDSVPGADAYIVIRDKKEQTSPQRMEGSNKRWTDTDRGWVGRRAEP